MTVPLRFGGLFFSIEGTVNIKGFQPSREALKLPFD